MIHYTVYYTVSYEHRYHYFMNLKSTELTPQRVWKRGNTISKKVDIRTIANIGYREEVVFGINLVSRQNSTRRLFLCML